MHTPKEPRVLLLETSGRAGQVALALGDKVLSARRLDEARRHARDLAPAVADLLTEQNWKPNNVDFLIVSRGPGSYTGLRVGIMAAKVFAYATGCVLAAVDTFQVIANQAPADVREVDVLADAQQGKVYLQRFIRGASSFMQPATALIIQSFDAWLGDRGKDTWATGPGLRAPQAVSLPKVIDEDLWGPQVPSLLQVGMERYRADQFDDVWKVEPLYLRASAAEEQLRSRVH